MSINMYVFAEDVTKPPFSASPPLSNVVSRKVVIPDGSAACMLTSLIKNGKRKEEKISNLHLISHGDAGKLFLRGARHEPIDEGGAWWFGALRGHFDSLMPMVIIHGCGSASGTSIWPSCKGSYGAAGYNFLSVMAQATQAFVEAGIHCQSNDGLYELEGPTVLVGPQGS